jgi:hypothetical protein
VDAVEHDLCRSIVGVMVGFEGCRQRVLCR